MKRLMSAYPLLVNDPYYSFYLDGEILNKNNIIHWTGKTKNLIGIIKIDDKEYCFLGNDNKSTLLKQTDIKVGLFDTTFIFDNEDFVLKISFISPLLITELDILSNPSCYIKYQFVARKKYDNLEIKIRLHENITYQEKGNMRSDVLNLKDYEVAYFGKRKQDIFSHSADMVCADWGYYYLTGNKCDVINDNDITYLEATNYHHVKKGVEINDKFVVSFDDVVSIYYFGHFLRNYYFKDNKTIYDAINDAYYNIDKILDKCKKFEDKLFIDIKEYGDDYKNIIISSYRQAMSGHKLVCDYDGTLLYFSKENGSDGCIGTVDITYPTMPLFLSYNPQLLIAALRPITKFARMDVWEYDFAPHDVGVYPYCLGQFYAVYNKESKYQRRVTFYNEDEGVLPFYYTYPKGQNIYSFEKQMPVEESGNMIIIAYLACKECNDYSFIKDNMDLYTTWADYLLSVSTFQFNQLCTDDFAGPSEGNINLAIKATVALATFSKICKLFNKDGSKYNNEALKRKDEIIKLVVDNHLPLTNKDNSDTFSLKYNLFADIICNTNLFTNLLKENEVDEYLKHQNEYGIPLDSRKEYSKTDWQIWVAELTDDINKKKIIYKKINEFIKNTNDRVAFVDWYYTDSGDASKYGFDNRMFTNRPVQAGCFATIYNKLRKERE